MIIFGARGKTIAGPSWRGAACVACGKGDHASYGVLRYFHLFFVPMFPIKREVATQCLHCRKTLAGDELPAAVRTDLGRQIFTGGRTLTAFIGTFIAACLLLFVVVVGGGESREQAGYLQSPMRGDRYVVRAADVLPKADAKHPYAILEVASVSPAEVDLFVGTIAYPTSRRALKAIRTNEIAAPGYFDAPHIKLPVAALPSLKAKGTIDSVKRP